jgi:hypothetical protein
MTSDDIQGAREEGMIFKWTAPARKLAQSGNINKYY